MAEPLALVRAAFRAAFGTPPSDVREEAALGDIPGWDSIGHLKLMTELERRLGRRLTLAQLRGARTVRALVELARSQ